VVSVSIASAPFTFEGAAVSTVTASTNGLLLLKSYAARQASQQVGAECVRPSGSVLAPFWDDLDHNIAFRIRTRSTSASRR